MDLLGKMSRSSGLITSKIMKSVVQKLQILLCPAGLKRLRSADVDDVCVWFWTADGQYCVLRLIKHS